MIVVGICKAENNRKSHHDTGVALLRYMLARFCKADSLSEISYTDKGKPCVDDMIFSVSHSLDVVCAAVYCDSFSDALEDNEPDDLEFIIIGDACGVSSIGVDIQNIDFMGVERYRMIAEKKFFASENLLLDNCDSDEAYARCFCKLWTMKESYCKKTGNGLVDAMSFDSVGNSSGLNFFSRCITKCGKGYYLSVCYNS